MEQMTAEVLEEPRGGTRFFSLQNLHPPTSLCSPDNGVILQPNLWGTGYGTEPPSREDQLQRLSSAGSEPQEWNVTLTKPEAVGTLGFLQARGGQQWRTEMAGQCGQTSQITPRLPALVSPASSPRAGEMACALLSWDPQHPQRKAKDSGACL